MKVNSISSKGSFEIVQDEKKLAEVNYEKYFSSECKTDLNGEKILIKPKNIWQSKFNIYKNGIDIGDIIFSWKGEIIIELNQKEEQIWILRAKGFWKYRFEVSTENNELIMALKPNFSGKTWKYNYEVELINSEMSENKLTEILIYACFAANLYKTKQDNMEI